MGGGGANPAGRDGEGVRRAHDGADEEGDGAGAVGVPARADTLGEGPRGGGEGGEDERESHLCLHGDHLPLVQAEV